MNVFTKLRNYMMGTDYEEDQYDDDIYDEADDDDYEDSRDMRREREREREKERVDYSATRLKKHTGDSKILTLPGYVNNESAVTRLIICRPEVVDDATCICDHLKNNILCAVNLEGVDRANAQRIADFLGGACYAVSGGIQRISNDIFIIAPSNVTISTAMKDELKSSSLILPWISSAFR